MVNDSLCFSGTIVMALYQLKVYTCNPIYEMYNPIYNQLSQIYNQ